jgi:bifunctional non-homologous end joining protein LigD
MPKPDNSEILILDGYSVRISNPQKPYFACDAALTKLDIVKYFLAVAGDAVGGALRGIADRPIVLKRFVDGACIEGKHPEPFYQKRAPSDLPEFVRTVELRFPSGRTADEVVIDNTAALAWIVNLGCIELHPHPVRTADLEHPDELRIDLDPVPGVEFNDVRRVAMEVRALLDEHGLRAFAKTSGSRGIHVNVRIAPQWSFTEVRRAALAVAREMERRMPGIATSKWWKEERQGVFLDYNQNAKDRTTAAAYSVRPLPDARVSAPLAWDEVMTCDPADFTVATMPSRFSNTGDPHAAMNNAAGSLQSLLELAARDEASGLGDAPWPPHFAKGEKEGARVTPSRAKKSTSFGQQMGDGFGAQRFRRQTKNRADAAIQGPGEAGVEHKAESVVAEMTSESAANQTPATRKARKSTKPLVIVAQSPDRIAIDGALEAWKQRHAEAAKDLQPADILIDRMRGAAYVWYRLRINLEHVPEDLRPAQETIDPDDDPTRTWRNEVSE